MVHLHSGILRSREKEGALPFMDGTGTHTLGRGTVRGPNPSEEGPGVKKAKRRLFHTAHESRVQGLGARREQCPLSRGNLALLPLQGSSGRERAPRPVFVRVAKGETLAPGNEITQQVP